MRAFLVFALLVAASPALASPDDGSCPLSQASPFDDLVHATFVGSKPDGGWATVVDHPVVMTVQNGPKCGLYALQAVMRFETDDGGGVPVVDRPATMTKYGPPDASGTPMVLPFASPPAESLLRHAERTIAETIDRTGVAIAAFGAQDALFDAARIDGDTVDGGMSITALADLARHYGYRARLVPSANATIAGLEQAVDAGTPVLTGFIVDRRGNPCTRIGGDCLGLHAVVIEGYGVAKDGTRWVIAKHPASTTPYVWREDDFERSRRAAGSGLVIVEPKI